MFRRQPCSVFFSGGAVRYRTAAILSALLIVVTGGMFGLPAAVWAAFLPSLKQGLPDPIPDWERILLEAAVFCGNWKWIVAVLTPPTVVVLFTIAVFTSGSRVHRITTPTPPPASRIPALWNPKAAACWSLLFSPAFGAFLHARNADVMGRVDEAKSNRAWFYVSIAYLGFTLVTISIPGVPEGLIRLAGIGLLLGWFFSLGRKQITYVDETWRDRYKRRPWMKPLLIAFCCSVGTLLILKVAEQLLRGSR
jgi:hypothetical protein